MVQAQQNSANLEDLVINYDQKFTRSQVSLGAETVNLSSSGASIMGLGSRAGFEYSLDDRFSLGANMMFCFQASGKPGAFFYSGLNGLIRYAFRGSSIKYSDSIKRRDGTLIYEVTPAARKRMTAFIGMEQLFLNGSTSIYPAVGPTAGGSYGFGLWGQSIEIDARYSMLTANDNPLSALSVGASINMDF